MKKILTLFLVLVLALSLTGCSSSAKETKLDSFLKEIELLLADNYVLSENDRFTLDSTPDEEIIIYHLYDNDNTLVKKGFISLTINKSNEVIRMSVYYDAQGEHPCYNFDAAFIDIVLKVTAFLENDEFDNKDFFKYHQTDNIIDLSNSDDDVFKCFSDDHIYRTSTSTWKDDFARNCFTVEINQRPIVLKEAKNDVNYSLALQAIEVVDDILDFNITYEEGRDQLDRIKKRLVDDDTANSTIRSCISILNSEASIQYLNELSGETPNDNEILEERNYLALYIGEEAIN